MIFGSEAQIIKYEFDRTKKTNVKLRYIIAISICQVLNSKRSIFDINDYCQVEIWKKINRFINLNKKFKIDIYKCEFVHCSNKIKVIDKNSIIIFVFLDNKVKDFNIIKNTLRNE